MTAGDFGNLTLSGVLNVNATGFVVGSNGNTAVFVSGSGASLFVNNGGAVSVTNGGLSLVVGAGATLAGGSTVALAGSLLLGNNTAASTGFLTNNGGTLSAAATTLNPNNVTGASRLIINGGINNLGNVSVLRSAAGSGGYSTLGTEGLIINNGQVNMTSFNVGTPAATSFLTAMLVNGTVTNSGDMAVRELTSARGARFLQTGGLFVNNGMTKLALTNAGQIIIYSITGGTMAAAAATPARSPGPSVAKTLPPTLTATSSTATTPPPSSRRAPHLDAQRHGQHLHGQHYCQ